DGRVPLRGAAERTFGVNLLGPGHIPAQQSAVRLDVEGELVVHVQRGARLTGRVVPPEAVAELRRLAKADGNTFPAAYRPRLELLGDDGFFPSSSAHIADFKDLFLADDGSFAAAGLPPGAWTVAVRAWVLDPTIGSDHVFRCTSVSLVDGKETHQDL